MQFLFVPLQVSAASQAFAGFAVWQIVVLSVTMLSTQTAARVASHRARRIGLLGLSLALVHEVPGDATFTTHVLSVPLQDIRRVAGIPGSRRIAHGRGVRSPTRSRRRHFRHQCRARHNELLGSSLALAHDVSERPSSPRTSCRFRCRYPPRQQAFREPPVARWCGVRLQLGPRRRRSRHKCRARPQGCSGRARASCTRCLATRDVHHARLVRVAAAGIGHVAGVPGVCRRAFERVVRDEGVSHTPLPSRVSGNRRTSRIGRARADRRHLANFTTHVLSRTAARIGRIARIAGVCRCASNVSSVTMLLPTQTPLYGYRCHARRKGCSDRPSESCRGCFRARARTSWRRKLR